jgi:hypothetical protein
VTMNVSCPEWKHSITQNTPFSTIKKDFDINELEDYYNQIVQ